MKFEIGNLKSGATSVPVSFEHAGVKHVREVNAVFTKGKYDRAATKARVEEVANGVTAKIAAGVITNETGSAPLQPSPPEPAGE